MVKDSTAIGPKPIISLMFAISVGFWAKELAQYITDTNTTNVQWWLTLVSGVLFLIDLLCIVWWYARYIYRVQPKASFGTYFLDFVVCSMFALAANSWTKPTIFLFATVCASGFLVCRFVLLYVSSSASLTDRTILRRAFFFLGLALLIALFGLSALQNKWPTLKIGLKWEGHGLPGALSLIGILLTVYMKNKIDVALAIYSAKYRLVSPAHLSWPASGVPNIEQRERIRQQVKDGLKEFDDLFCKFRKHDRIHSRVHSETQLRVQSYILALPSCEKQNYAEEIGKKAFMVAVSHWLDDLVDGRNEVEVYKQLKKYRRLQDGPCLSDEKGKAEKLFRQIYQPLIVKHTDRKFCDELIRMIFESSPLPFNRKYMLLGLNRVAYSAVIFSPKITREQRMDMLDDHNDFLKEWNVEEKGDFEQEVEDIIGEITVGNEAGPILLGLTTKTVQEIALSSEREPLNIGMSILFSILYAPLIYYHNIIEELENNEMVPLQAFDTDSDLWIPWLERTRKAIDMAWDSNIVGDGERERAERERKQVRIKQMEMAYRCFEPKLPKSIRPKLAKIYLRELEDVSPTS